MSLTPRDPGRGGPPRRGRTGVERARAGGRPGGRSAGRGGGGGGGPRRRGGGGRGAGGGGGGGGGAGGGGRGGGGADQYTRWRVGGGGAGGLAPLKKMAMRTYFRSEGSRGASP